MQQQHPFSAYQKLVIALIAFTQFTVVLDFMIMSPLGDELIKSMSMSTEQFGWVVSGYAFSAGLSGILTAGFADRFDRKKLLLFFYIGFIGGTLLCGLAPSYITLLLARIVTGLFGGVISSISMSIIADLFVLQQRGRVMGFVQMGFGLSQILGIPLGLHLSNRWGWHIPFLGIVGLALLIWFVIWLKFKPITLHLVKPHEDQKHPLMHLWMVLRQRRYRVGFMATALLSLGGFMMMPYSSAYAINNLGVSKEDLPKLFMVSGAFSLVMMPLIGKLSDRMDKWRVYTLASVWLMVMVVFYTNLNSQSFALILIANTLMMMGVMARMVPAMALTSALPSLEDRGAFMSINSSLQQIAGGVSAAIGGFIVRQANPHSPLQHFDWVGYIVVLITMFSIWIYARVRRSVAS